MVTRRGIELPILIYSKISPYWITRSLMCELSACPDLRKDLSTKWRVLRDVNVKINKNTVLYVNVWDRSLCEALNRRPAS